MGSASVTSPLWALLAIAVILAVMFRAVRLWLAIVCVGLGLYLASTTLGKATVGTVNQITHSTSTPVSTSSPSHGK